MSRPGVPARVRRGVLSAVEGDDRVRITAVSVTLGWGDVLQVVIRATASGDFSRDDLDRVLRKAVVGAAEGVRSRITITWSADR
jgi:hypothetical protein